MSNHNNYLTEEEIQKIANALPQPIANDVIEAFEVEEYGGARKKKSHRQLSKSNVIKHIQKLSKDLGIQSRVTVRFAKKSPAKKSRSRKSPAKKSPAKRSPSKKYSPKKSSPKRRRTSPKKSSPKRRRASPKAK
jgi:hypothetical protein